MKPSMKALVYGNQTRVRNTAVGYTLYHSFNLMLMVFQLVRLSNDTWTWENSYSLCLQVFQYFLGIPLSFRVTRDMPCTVLHSN